MDVFQAQMENNCEIEVLQANELSYNKVAEISEDEHLCCNVVISIEDMLKQLPPVNGDCSIYRVPKQLREMNLKAYTPQLISIGPFHHGCQKDFRVMEQYKLNALINFLHRINYKKMGSLEEDVVKIISLEDLLKTRSLKVLVEKARCWVKEAHKCYAEPINMNDHNFLIMMLVDACFIVEFFILIYDILHPLDCKFVQNQDNNINFSLLYRDITLSIFYDLIKLENQVPFFLLQHIFDLIPEDTRPVCFMRLTSSILRLGLVGYESCSFMSSKEPKHLVDFLGFYFFPLLPEMQNKQHEKNSENKINFLSFLPTHFLAHWQRQHKESSEKKKNKFLSFFGVHLCCLWNEKVDEQNSKDETWIIPPSTTELCEAGVTIKKAKKAKYVMNISFENGVLEIPPLHIYDHFELMFRNMIAFEQFIVGNKTTYVTQYILFFDGLISTEKDVRSLVKAGVIINGIGGNDKEVSDLFNNLGKFATIPFASYHFHHINKALHEHCNGWWNKEKASLKHNYFNTPWAFISFSAATFLILLTILQTIFSAISTFPS